MGPAALAPFLYEYQFAVVDKVLAALCEYMINLEAQLIALDAKIRDSDTQPR